LLGGLHEVDPSRSEHDEQGHAGDAHEELVAAVARNCAERVDRERESSKAGQLQNAEDPGRSEPGQVEPTGRDVAREIREEIEEREERDEVAEASSGRSGVARVTGADPGAQDVLEAEGNEHGPLQDREDRSPLPERGLSLQDAGERAEQNEAEDDLDRSRSAIARPGTRVELAVDAVAERHR
jgi:hypothetical protein